MLISRAKLGNKHVIGHQIIVFISDFFMLFYGICFFNNPMVNTWSIGHGRRYYNHYNMYFELHYSLYILAREVGKIQG